MASRTYQELLDQCRACIANTTPGTWIRTDTGIISYVSAPPDPYRVVYFAGWPPAIPFDGDIAFLVWAHNIIDTVIMGAEEFVDMRNQRDALRAVLSEALEYIKGDYEGAHWPAGAAGELYMRGRQLLDKGD